MDKTNEFSFLLKPSTHGVGVFAAHDIKINTPMRLFGDANPRRILKKDDIPEEFRVKTTKKAQKNLLSATTEHDFSEIGNLCVQFWEDFTDALWDYCMPNEQKPEKDKTGNKITPIAAKLIASKTTSDVYKALGDLFIAISKLAQKTKHRGAQDKPVTLRDAKMVLLLTIVLAEEILSYL